MGIRAWLVSTDERVFPGARPRRGRALTLCAARGMSVSAQVAVSAGWTGSTMRVGVVAAAPTPLRTRVRRVGFVPLPHHNTETARGELDGPGAVPGLVPDPLFDEQETVVAPGDTAAFWLTIVPGGGCPPGRHLVDVTVVADGEPAAALEIALDVHDVDLAPRRGFPVTHWFYSDALLDWYGCDGFDERYWRILPRYLENLAAHGQDVLYVPVFTPPLDGVKRPTQLLGVRRAGDGWRFDWSLVKRYVEAARRSGIDSFEWTHLFSQWGARDALRVYEGRGEAERLLWRPGLPGRSREYRAFLRSWLPRLREFLHREGLLGRSYFHVSDEPQGTEALRNYREARVFLAREAPWMKTMDALSEIEYGRDRVTDMPVATITEAPRFRSEGIACWGYFCCGPRGAFLNRLLDTPLAKIRMSGWLFYRFGLSGFLHWGANYWYRRATRELVDPFTESSGFAWPDWAYGDPFVVYPGADGPIDSLRWEVFAESLQDYALLQAAGIDPADRLLARLVSFARFPRERGWTARMRRRLLESAGPRALR